jgi:hypothetical protein
MATKKNATQTERPVVVTTEHRGVFFGYATDTSGDTIHLKRARNCVYWSSDIRGFMGLAATGPSRTCRVGPSADGEVRRVTSVMEATPEAVKAWEAAPWGQ